MKRQPIPEQRAEQVVAIIRANPGVDRYEIARLAGLPVRLACVALLVARSQGLIGCVYVAQRVLGWFLIERVPAELLAAAQRKKAARLMRERRSRAEKRDPASKKATPAPVDPGDVPMIRRQVDASAPLPFKCRAVSSVFDLGAA
jgi:hypothetical protein